MRTLWFEVLVLVIAGSLLALLRFYATELRELWVRYYRRIKRDHK